FPVGELVILHAATLPARREAASLQLTAPLRKGVALRLAIRPSIGNAGARSLASLRPVLSFSRVQCWQHSSKLHRMLNRAVLIVRPARPFLDWAASLDDSGLLPSADGEQTVYLVPEYESEAEQRQVLQEVFAEVFERELFGWHTDESAWPERRTLAMFRKWFVIEMHSTVEDLCASPIEDDDLDDDA
ncbi:hypothetical protein, partial [Aquabacterium humicola]|uniref:hypothetical protein n=1 Tax=Aquabacterium humicola TaxID=3237377 RepID=UPI0025429DC9